eukprot:3495731-Rhodomonas_salina.1
MECNTPSVLSQVELPPVLSMSKQVNCSHCQACAHTDFNWNPFGTRGRSGSRGRARSPAGRGQRKTQKRPSSPNRNGGGAPTFLPMQRANGPRQASATYTRQIRNAGCCRINFAN